MGEGDPAPRPRPFEDNSTAVCGDVEVSNIEVGIEIAEQPLGALLKVAPPQIFVLILLAGATSALRPQ
jgi:hypothetical protein